MPHFGMPRRVVETPVGTKTQVNWRRGFFRIWLLLSAAGGLSSPGIILRAFAVGAPVSVLAASVLCRPEVLGSIGYLYGFGAGQLVTLAMLLYGTQRALFDRWTAKYHFGLRSLGVRGALHRLIQSISARTPA